MEDVVKAEEYFYTTTLDKKGASVTWGSKELQETISSPDRLHLRQILLGHTAKEGEYNVVEVETTSLHGTVKVPIAVLKAGETRVIQSNLEFPDGPVTFRLTEGQGPVYIQGSQVPSVYEDELAEEEEELDEEEDAEEEANPKKKACGPNHGQAWSKQNSKKSK